MANDSGMRKVTCNGTTVQVPSTLSESEVLKALSRSFPSAVNGTVKKNEDGSWVVEPKPGDKGC